MLYVSFLQAVTLAGLAFLLGTVLVRRISLLRKFYIPAPAIGGLIVAVVILLLRLVGLDIFLPLSGYDVDFLAALLTANMGLHVTTKVLRQDGVVFFLVLGVAFVLALVQFVLVLPFAFLRHDVIARAIVMGPLSFTGAPFNLNPPNQVPFFLGTLLQPAFHAARVKSVAQGQMMIGVVIGMFLTGVVGRAIFKRAGTQPPRPDPDDRHDSANVWVITTQEVALLVLILALTSLAFIVQAVIIHYFPWFRRSFVPSIVLAYLFAIVFRLIWEAVMPKPKRDFPKKSLGILLYGPTMGITLTYPLMGIPLYNLHLVDWTMVIAGLLAIAGSVLVAWLSFSLFARFVDRYYAAVVSIAFLAITTGWGPLGMAYLRRFTDEEGPVPPMPIILPLGSFYVIPWLTTGVSYALLRLFGA